MLPFLISGSLIVLFSLLLYFDFKKKSSAGNVQQIGTIVSTRELAQRKYGEAVTWEEIGRRTPVYDGDSLRTSARSGAVVRLNDGSAIELDENSMVLLSMSRDNLDVRFEGGSVIARKAAGDTGTGINLVTRDARVTVNSGDLSAKMDREKTDLSVSKGGVSVISGKTGTVDLSSDKKAVILADGGTRVTAVTLALLKPLPGETIPYAARGIEFSAKTDRASEPVQLVVSRDSAFRKTLHAVRIRNGKADVKLEPGHYYCRLSGNIKDRAGKNFSDIVSFNVVRQTPVSLISPRKGETLQYSGNSPVFFKWAPDPEAVEYRLSVTRDEKQVTQVTTSESSIVVDLPGEGQYRWRVEKKTGLDSVAGKAPSAEGNFKLRKNIYLARPDLLYPRNDAIVTSSVIKKRRLVFTWKGDPLGGSYRLRVARKGEEDRPPVYVTTGKTSWVCEKQLAPGNYVWNVEALAMRGQASSWSDVYSLNVMDSIVIRTVEPESGSVFTYPFQGRAKVRFTWKGLPGENLYRLEITDRDRKNRRYIDLKDSSLLLDDVTAGNYSWRIRQLDAQGETIAETGYTLFSAVEKPGPPLIVSPAEGETVNLRNRDYVVFRWKGRGPASFYRISIYRITGDMQQWIFSDKTKSNEYRFNRLKLMDYGTFVWNIKSYNVRGPGNSASEVEGEGATGSFTVTLGEHLKKPVIVTPGTVYRK